MANYPLMNFRTCTYDEYIRCYPQREATLYFVTDRHLIYLGQHLYSRSQALNVEIIGTGDIITNIQYDAELAKLTVTVADAQSISSIGITNISENDKILSVDVNKHLTAKVSVSLSSDAQTKKQYIKLFGVNDTEISVVDASEFVSTGMVTSVGIATKTVEGEPHKFLQLHFRDVGGSQGLTEVDIQDLMPKGGSIGVQGQVTKLLTFASVDTEGKLTGETVDVVSTIDNNSTDSQIPTAKAVNTLVNDKTFKWSVN